MSHILKVIGSVLLGNMVLVGCQTNNNQNKSGTKESSKENQANQVKGTGFPNWGYDVQHTRHVPYTKVTKDNVKKLGVVWQQDLTAWDQDVPNLQEANPIVQNGIMYVTSAKNYTFAIDAGSGKKLWE